MGACAVHCAALLHEIVFHQLKKARRFLPGFFRTTKNDFKMIRGAVGVPDLLAGRLSAAYLLPVTIAGALDFPV